MRENAKQFWESVAAKERTFVRPCGHVGIRVLDSMLGNALDGAHSKVQLLYVDYFVTIRTVVIEVLESSSG